MLTPVASSEPKTRKTRSFGPTLTPPAKPPAKTEGPRVWVRAPVQDLLALFPGKGAGFLISIDEYGDLVRRAEQNVRLAEARPPLAARIVRGTATAQVKDDEFLNIAAKYTVVVTNADRASAAIPKGHISSSPSPCP